VAEDGVREGEAVECAAQQHGREQVPDGEHELQVGDRLLGSALVRRERGQRQPAEVLRQANVGRCGPVQLGQRTVDPGIGTVGAFTGSGVRAEPRLEEPGERKRRRGVRPGIDSAEKNWYPSASARSAASLLASVTRVFLSAPGQPAAVLSDSTSRRRVMRPVMPVIPSM
jgi:hypothetical protein